MGFEYAVTIGVVVFMTSGLAAALAGRSTTVRSALPLVALPALVYVAGTIAGSFLSNLHNLGAANDGLTFGDHPVSSGLLCVLGAAVGIGATAIAASGWNDSWRRWLDAARTAVVAAPPDDDEPATAEDAGPETSVVDDEEDDEPVPALLGFCGLAGVAVAIAAQAPTPLQHISDGYSARTFLPQVAAFAFAAALAGLVIADDDVPTAALAVVAVVAAGGALLALLVSAAAPDNQVGGELRGFLDGLAVGLVVLPVVEATTSALLATRFRFPLRELAAGLALLGVVYLVAGLVETKPNFDSVPLGLSPSASPHP